MLTEDYDRERHRCVEVFLQWSFAFNSDRESFISTVADTVLPSYEEGETYQEFAVKSWAYYFDRREMLNVKKRAKGK